MNIIEDGTVIEIRIEAVRGRKPLPQPYLSHFGTLVHISSDKSSNQIVLLDQNGQIIDVMRQQFGAISDPALSPDRQRVAFQGATEGNFDSGQFPSGEGRWPVSSNGGRFPIWRGNKIFYASPTNELMVSSVKTSPRFQSEKPTMLLKGNDLDVEFTGIISGFPVRKYDVSTDGQRIVAIQATRESRAAITVVENWAQEFE